MEVKIQDCENLWFTLFDQVIKGGILIIRVIFSFNLAWRSLILMQS